jgi:hypothetical protein
MKLRKLMVAVFAFFAGLAQAQQMSPIPADPDVVVGKLDNGLTYYIRHNNWPENRADFYIAQKVGAIQEEESQRGLAHFLEHMCFNGTKHFPGNGVIRYCESIGVQFGRDLNAYTAIDQTVYNISTSFGVELPDTFVESCPSERSALAILPARAFCSSVEENAPSPLLPITPLESVSVV